MLIRNNDDHDLAATGWLRRCTDIIWQLPSRRQRYAFGRRLAAVLIQNAAGIAALEEAIDNLHDHAGPRLTEDQAIQLCGPLWDAREVGHGIVLCHPLTPEEQRGLDQRRELYAVLDPCFKNGKTIVRALQRRGGFTDEQCGAWLELMIWQRETFQREIEQAQPYWLMWLRAHPEVGGPGLQERFGIPVDHESESMADGA